MVRVDQLYHSSCADAHLAGHSGYSFIEIWFMCNGVFLFCIACFFGYAFGDLPRGFEYLWRKEFWMYRYLNLNEEDIAKELYMGYGIGLGPLLVIPAIWAFMLL